MRFRTVTRAFTVAATALALAATGSPAHADYGGRVYTLTAGGNAGYTVRRLTLNHAEVTGVVRDTRADGRCVSVEATMLIDLSFDPVTSKTTCGAGTTKSFRLYSFDPMGYERVQGVRLRVCLRTSSWGRRFSCRSRLLTTLTT